jgi:hypothetical protein
MAREDLKGMLPDPWHTKNNGNVPKSVFLKRIKYFVFYFSNKNKVF